jgi:hypothetical protein
VSQNLHESVAAQWLNEHLEAGAMVVWVSPAPSVNSEPRWHAVLDHPEQVDDLAVVAGFLHSLNPGALDEAMARGARLSESPGTAAKRFLLSLVGDGP